MHTFTSDFPWVLFNLDDCQYAICCEKVEAMVILKDITPIPNLPEHIRGIIHRRGKVIHCVDLRVMMGLSPLKNEIDAFMETLTQQENDFVRWFEEIVSSVNEHREFKLTTDPHGCAFGKWYESFVSNDMVFSIHLKKFDAPHKAMCRMAREVKEMVARKHYSGAGMIIQKMKNNEFKEIIALFALLKTAYVASKHEIVIIFEGTHNRSCGIIVDEVLSVEPIHADSIESLHDRMVDTQLSQRIGKRRKDNSLVVLLDPELFEMEVAAT